MFFLIQVVILISMLAARMPAPAQTSDPSTPEPLVLTDEQGKYPLGLHMEILEDPGGKLTIEDVSSPEFDSRFIPSQVEAPNYGFTNSAYWVRLRLDNETRLIDEWLLEVNFANMHYVDLYMPSQDGEGFEVKQTGLLRPVSTRDVIYPNIVFDLVVPTQSPQTYYLRFQNGASMTLSLTLWTKDAFWIESQQELMLHWLFYGVLIGLLFYNLFLLFSLREANYLYYLIELAATIFFVLSYDGYLGIYVLPILYPFVLICTTLSWGLLFISIVLFTDSFLEIKTKSSKTPLGECCYRGSLGHVNGLVAVHQLSFYGHPDGALGFAFPGSDPRCRDQFLAEEVPTRQVVLDRLVRSACNISRGNTHTDGNYLQSQSLVRICIRLGMVWLGVCWSFALADRINLLKAETENANRELRKQRASAISDPGWSTTGSFIVWERSKTQVCQPATFTIFSTTRPKMFRWILQVGVHWHRRSPISHLRWQAPVRNTR